MEAYPYVDDISSILSNYWRTPAEKRGELPGIEIIERIRDMVETAFNANPDHAGFIKIFIEKQGDKGMVSEFSDRLKYLLYQNENLANDLEKLAKDFKDNVNLNYTGNVNIEWGESTIKGSTAQVTQTRKVEIDTIDSSKFIEES